MLVSLVLVSLVLVSLVLDSLVLSLVSVAVAPTSSVLVVSSVGQPLAHTTKARATHEGMVRMLRFSTAPAGSTSPRNRACASEYEHDPAEGSTRRYCWTQ